MIKKLLYKTIAVTFACNWLFVGVLLANQGKHSVFAQTDYKINNYTIKGLDVRDSAGSYGISAGYMYNLTSKFSLGGSISYNIINAKFNSKIGLDSNFFEIQSYNDNHLDFSDNTSSYEISNIPYDYVIRGVLDDDDLFIIYNNTSVTLKNSIDLNINAQYNLYSSNKFNVFGFANIGYTKQKVQILKNSYTKQAEELGWSILPTLPKDLTVDKIDKYVNDNLKYWQDLLGDETKDKEYLGYIAYYSNPDLATRDNEIELVYSNQPIKPLNVKDLVDDINSEDDFIYFNNNIINKQINTLNYALGLGVSYNVKPAWQLQAKLGYYATMQSSVSYYKYNNTIRQYLLKDEDFKNFNVDAKNTIKINSYAVGVNLGVKYTF